MMFLNSIFTANNLASLALIISLVAIWLNYNTSRRQKLAENPMLVFRRGKDCNIIKLTNMGVSPAFDVSVEIKKVGFVKWHDQINQELRKPDGGGGFTGGEEPWTTNCSGETRTIDVKETKLIIPTKNESKDRVIICRYKNYMGVKIKQQKALSQIYWE